MKRGLGGIIYGPEGMGKTTTALQFKKDLLCISLNENGYDNLEMIGKTPEGCDQSKPAKYREFLNELKQAKDYATVVVDSMSGLQQLMGTEILNTIYKDKDNPQAAFGAFSEGFRVHGPVLAEQVCNELTLLLNRGTNVILLGHAKQETIKSPNSADYNATVIDMESWPRGVFKKWAGFILYFTIDLEVMATKTWKGKTVEAKIKTDLEEETDRICFTRKHASHEAKNLFDLPLYISLGESPEEAYRNIMSKFPEKVKVDQEFVS